MRPVFRVDRIRYLNTCFYEVKGGEFGPEKRSCYEQNSGIYRTNQHVRLGQKFTVHYDSILENTIEICYISRYIMIEPKLTLGFQWFKAIECISWYSMISLVTLTQA